MNISQALIQNESSSPIMVLTTVTVKTCINSRPSMIHAVFFFFSLLLICLHLSKMDELASTVRDDDDSFTRVRRLVLHLLESQTKIEQDVEDLRIQQEWLSVDLRTQQERLSINLMNKQERLSADLKKKQKQLSAKLAILEETTSAKTQPPPSPEQPPLSKQDQKQANTTHPKQTQQTLELDDAAQTLPPKKRKMSIDDDRQSDKAPTSKSVEKKPALTEGASTKSQEQRLKREERAKKLSQRHQEARKEAQQQKRR